MPFLHSAPCLKGRGPRSGEGIQLRKNLLLYLLIVKIDIPGGVQIILLLKTFPYFCGDKSSKNPRGSFDSPGGELTEGQEKPPWGARPPDLNPPTVSDGPPSFRQGGLDQGAPLEPQKYVGADAHIRPL